MIKFSEKQREIIRASFKHTLEVLEGTPRSGKTTASVFRFCYFLSISEDQNHLVVAYNQEQAYRLFIECDGLGVKHVFGSLCQHKHDENGPHLEIHTPRGIKKVYYKGGGKADSHKSIQGMSFGSIVFCEINLLHMNMIQECFRRTFAAKRRFHLADLNPPPPNHPVIKEVFDVQDTKWTHFRIDDNPIITEERKQELYEILKKSEYLLNRDWFGKRVMPQGVIYAMFDMDKHVAKAVMGEPYEAFFSADAGQGDATSVSFNIVTRYQNKFRLNRVANYYHSGKETRQVKAMSVYAREIKEFIKWCVEKFEMRYSYFFVDPSAKSLREELRLIGVETRGADNNAKDIEGGKKGIEVGIERLQNAMNDKRFFLVENEEYGHYYFIREIGMYVRDDNGKPIDEWNHTLDEARYANNYFYKRYVL